MNGAAKHSEVLAVLEKFFAGQREMYKGGSLSTVEELLDEDVVWHVPGHSPIGGTYRGREAVLGYFRRRRELAGGALHVTRGASAAHDEAMVQLADGQMTVDGEEVAWRTAGVYRVADGKVAEAWLVPLSLDGFEAVWAATRTDPFRYEQRVRPQDCAASAFLGHPRFLEFFEAAFIECWRTRYGAIDDSLGVDRRLTVAAVNVRYLAPVRADEVVSIDVWFDRVGTTSVKVHYAASVGDVTVAEADTRYVCLEATTGRPAALSFAPQ